MATPETMAGGYGAGISQGQGNTLYGPILYRFKTGLYYTSTASTIGTAAIVQGNMLASVFIVGKTTTFDRIGVEVTSAGEAGAMLRLGIYADTGDSYPGALVLDAGQVAGDAIAGVEATISQSLTPGLYWVTAVPQACPTTPPTVRTNTALPAIGHGTSSLTNSTGSASRNAFLQTSVTGALPGTFTSTVSSQGGSPRVVLRAA